MQKRSAGSAADRTASKVRALYPRARLGGAPASRSEKNFPSEEQRHSDRVRASPRALANGTSLPGPGALTGSPRSRDPRGACCALRRWLLLALVPHQFRMPRANQQYWREKLSGNAARDLATRDALSTEGWLVLRVWEHELADGVDDVAERVATAVRTHARDPGRSRRRRAGP